MLGSDSSAVRRAESAKTKTTEMTPGTSRADQSAPKGTGPGTYLVCSSAERMAGSGRPAGAFDASPRKEGDKVEFEMGDPAKQSQRPPTERERERERESGSGKSWGGPTDGATIGQTDQLN